MKTLYWKIRYAYHIGRLLRLPLRMRWEMACTAAEEYGDDMEIWSPREAAEEERDAWLASC